MRTNEEIQAIIQTAFRPLCCVAEVWDYGQKLRFRISDEKGRAIVGAPNVVLRNVRDDGNLRTVITSTREIITQKGFRLEPWKF